MSISRFWSLALKGAIVIASLIYLLPMTGTAPRALAMGDSRTQEVVSTTDRAWRSDPCCVLYQPFTEYPIPTAPSGAEGITSGPDGNLWFTEWDGNKIGRITPTGSITEYPTPTPNGPQGITSGPDGNIWFTEQFGSKIGFIGTDGSIVEYPIPTANSYPEGITSGPDGNVWFAEMGGNKIAHTYVKTIWSRGEWFDETLIKEYPISTAYSQPVGITSGPDGHLWFTEIAANQIGRITPDGSSIIEYPIPTANSQPVGITSGPDGNVWFTEKAGNKIGRITPTGSITEYPLPTTDSELYGITSGPDGNVWFTEMAGNRIGRITPTGSITEYQIQTFRTTNPTTLTWGPDGHLWFTQPTEIGKFVP